MLTVCRDTEKWADTNSLPPSNLFSNCPPRHQSSSVLWFAEYKLAISCTLHNREPHIIPVEEGWHPSHMLNMAGRWLYIGVAQRTLMEVCHALMHIQHGKTAFTQRQRCNPILTMLWRCVDTHYLTSLNLYYMYMYVQLDSPSIHLLPISEYASSSLSPALHQMTCQTINYQPLQWTLQGNTYNNNMYVMCMCITCI